MRGPLKKKQKTYYATTEIEQGDLRFRNTWDFTGNRTQENAIKHLTAMFEEAAIDEDCFEDVFEDFDETEINFHGMSPKYFATFLVEHNDEAKELYDTTWSIKVHHEVRA